MPANAHVELSNGFSGQTPVTFIVPRKDDLVVTVTKEGYEPVAVRSRAATSAPAAVGGVAGASAIGTGVGGIVAADMVAQTGAIGAAAALPAVGLVAAPVVVVGAVKDAFSGALQRHSPNPIIISLRPRAAGLEHGPSMAPPSPPTPSSPAPTRRAVQVNFRDEALPRRGNYPKIPGRARIAMTDQEATWVCATRPASAVDANGKYFAIAVGEITRQTAICAFANKFARAESDGPDRSDPTDVVVVKPRVQRFHFSFHEPRSVIYGAPEEKSVHVAIELRVDILGADGTLLLSRLYGQALGARSGSLTQPTDEIKTASSWSNTRWERLLSDAFHHRLYTLMADAAQDAEWLVAERARR